MRFEGKVAVVTGAAGGIGLAISRRLLVEGARVVLADLDLERVTAAAGSMAGGPVSLTRSFAQQCDVSREADVQRVCEFCIEQWGRLDVVVNNAGLMTFKPIADLEEADWMKVLKVDLLGAAYFIKHAFRRMTPGSAIVNVASIHALQTSQDAAPYAAAKAGMLSLTRTASIEGRRLGVRVNAVLPGAIDTPMLWDNPNVKSGAETIDRSAVGRPEDMAACVVFLASDDAAFVNGSALVADGGRLAKL